MKRPNNSMDFPYLPPVTRSSRRHPNPNILGRHNLGDPICLYEIGRERVEEELKNATLQLLNTAAEEQSVPAVGMSADSAPSTSAGTGAASNLLDNDDELFGFLTEPISVAAGDSWTLLKSASSASSFSSASSSSAGTGTSNLLLDKDDELFSFLKEQWRQEHHWIFMHTLATESEVFAILARNGMDICSGEPLCEGGNRAVLFHCQDANSNKFCKFKMKAQKQKALDCFELYYSAGKHNHILRYKQSCDETSADCLERSQLSPKVEENDTKSFDDTLGLGDNSNRQKQTAMRAYSKKTMLESEVSTTVNEGQPRATATATVTAYPMRRMVLRKFSAAGAVDVRQPTVKDYLQNRMAYLFAHKQKGNHRVGDGSDQMDCKTNAYRPDLAACKFQIIEPIATESPAEAAEEVEVVINEAQTTSASSSPAERSVPTETETTTTGGGGWLMMATVRDQAELDKLAANHSVVRAADNAKITDGIEFACQRSLRYPQQQKNNSFALLAIQNETGSIDVFCNGGEHCCDESGGEDFDTNIGEEAAAPNNKEYLPNKLVAIVNAIAKQRGLQVHRSIIRGCGVKSVTLTRLAIDCCASVKDALLSLVFGITTDGDLEIMAISGRRLKKAVLKNCWEADEEELNWLVRERCQLHFGQCS